MIQQPNFYNGFRLLIVIIINNVHRGQTASCALDWPAEVCVIFAELTLVLEVQLCPALCV